MIIGKLDNPKIECLRELFHSDANCKMLPLGVKKNQAAQKYRIPFKNTSLTLEAEFEFTFVKIPSTTQDDKDQEIMSCLEFYC
jgi:hypothetical protein